MKRKTALLAGLTGSMFAALLLLTGCSGGGGGGNSNAVVPPLPPLSADLAPRFRGASINEFRDWSDPTLSEWRHIDQFPQWGGNIISIILRPYFDGVPVLPGHPLTERLMKTLEHYTPLINWALQHHVYVNLRFNQVRNYPGQPFALWPYDDGRSLWQDASAQDELIQAWTHMAKHFKGEDGLLFNVVTEPATRETTETQGGLIWRAWNDLYPRLVAAIRAQDPNRWVIVEPAFGDPTNFAPLFGDPTNFPGLAVSSDPKVMYEFHFYFPHFFTCQGCGGDNPPAGTVDYPGTTADSTYESPMYWDKSELANRLQPAIAFRADNNVRLIAGEFGCDTQAPEASRVRWVGDVLDLLETNNFDWAYFTYNAGLVLQKSWNFDSTSLEPLITAKMALNLPG
jgi:hypothetical protein